MYSMKIKKKLYENWGRMFFLLFFFKKMKIGEEEN